MRRPILKSERGSAHVGLIAGVALAALLTGCATAETVMMQHPRTHEIVQCPAGYRGFIGSGSYRRQADCIADYQRKGYELPPGAPAK